MTDKTQEQLIDELIKGYTGPASFWGETGIFAQLKKKIIERTLDAEMDNHLGYSKHDPKGHNSGNSRNGKGKKTVVIDSEPVELEPPRDRNGSFGPQLVPKRQKYFEGFNDKILAMYARGMSVRAHTGMSAGYVQGGCFRRTYQPGNRRRYGRSQSLAESSA